MNEIIKISFDIEEVAKLKDNIKSITPCRYLSYNKSIHGYHVLFTNGYKLSIQFGPGHYADNHDMSFFDDDVEYQSTTAEIAYWQTLNDNGKLFDRPMETFIESGDTVLGYQTWEQVLSWMEKISEMEG